MRQYIRLLVNNPQYARLWLAQAVSLLGDWFNTIALSTMVSRFTGGSGEAVSFLLLARFLPPLLIGPLAGVLVDRFNRKHLLIFSDAARAAIVLLLLFAGRPDTLWLIYVLTVVQFILSAVFEPGRSALLPAVVRDEDLVAANTLGSVTWSAMLALGAVVGGLVAGLFGSATALIIDVRNGDIRTESNGIRSPLTIA
jgi:MFS family permease